MEGKLQSSEVDHMQLTQRRCLLSQLLRELGQPLSALHKGARGRYHMGNDQLRISTAVLRRGKSWLKQKYPQTSTELVLQLLKGQS